MNKNNKFILLVILIVYFYSQLNATELSVSSFLDLKNQILSIQEDTEPKTVNGLLNNLSNQIDSVPKTYTDEIISILQEKIGYFPYQITEFIKKHSKIYRDTNVNYLTLAIGNKLNLKEYIPSNKPIILFFSAKWCDECKKVKPKLKELSKKNNVLIREIDILDWESESVDILKEYIPSGKKLFIPLIYVDTKTKFTTAY